MSAPQITRSINPGGTHIVTLGFMPVRGELYGPDFVGITATLWSRRGIQLGGADPEIIHLKFWSAHPLLAVTSAAIEADAVSFQRPITARQLFPADPACKGPFCETEIELNRAQFKAIAQATNVRIGDGHVWTGLAADHLSALRELAGNLDPAEPFEGSLEKGRTYKAVLSYQSDVGWWPDVPLRILPHHATRIEWRNLGDFPQAAEAESKPARLLAVFRVDDVEVSRMTPQRWNTIYYCTILEISGSR